MDNNTVEKKGKFTVAKQKQVVELITEGKTFSEACREVSISRSLEWLTRQEDPEYNKAIETAKSIRTQAVESKLYELCMDGNITAICFYLKTANPKKYAVALHPVEEHYHRRQVTEITMV